MSDVLSERESAVIGKLSGVLASIRPKNAEKWSYYDGEMTLKNIGIAIPEVMVNIEAVIGWGGIVVDALDERLDWQGWVAAGEESSGLSSVFRQNQLGTEFDKAKLDALVTGMGFLEISAGGEGEPDVVVNAVSSSDAVCIWDERRNRVAAGLVMKTDAETGDSLTTLYFPNETVTVVEGSGDSRVYRHVHGRGRCGLVAFPNKSRAGAVRGQSELTRPIRYTIDHGVRTILGMEYNREIYTTPQRWFANVYPEDLGADGDLDGPELVQASWNVSMARNVILPPQAEDGSSKTVTPQTGQYAAAPPTPYIDELKMCTQLIAAYSGVPPQQLAFVSANPPSADSVRAMEARHVKMAERRASSFAHHLENDLAYIAQAILHERCPDRFMAPTQEFLEAVSAKWRDPATPTQAAATDAAVKIAQSEQMMRSPVLLERAGFTESEIKRLEQERRKADASALVQMAREKFRGGARVVESEGADAVGDGI